MHACKTCISTTNCEESTINYWRVEGIDCNLLGSISTLNDESLSLFGGILITEIIIVPLSFLASAVFDGSCYYLI